MQGEQERLVNAAARLPRLKTLVLGTSMEVLADAPPADTEWEAPTQQPVEWIEVLSGPKLNLRQCLRVAGTFMQVCRSLTRLSVPAAVKGGMMTFLRSNINNDEAVFDGCYSVEGSRWWMPFTVRGIRAGYA
ncbi:hypothetical protein H0H81_002750 [Sphagnurus paluster]|uniref:Uncharacterized protein n=1 Tax=Sphagnurus paluster TaxID=117069 RepID=A0A9P7GLR1_9AGAR|nr:hypothetical protein H0H81_002750 [Sphagnurus paluster]